MIKVGQGGDIPSLLSWCIITCGGGWGLIIIKVGGGGNIPSSSSWHVVTCGGGAHSVQIYDSNLDNTVT